MDVILADDQYDVRCALRCLLEQSAELRLVSEATNSAELLAYLSTACPDLVLLDWELPGINGRDLMERARAVCPKVKVVALSVRPEARAEALRAGAQGFASKGDPPERLVSVMLKVVSDDLTNNSVVTIVAP